MGYAHKKASPHRGSLEGAQLQSLPLTREVARREPRRRERSPEGLLFLEAMQNPTISLPQSASLTAPSSEGAFGPLRRGHPSGAPRQLPLTRGALGACKYRKPMQKGAV